MLIDFFRDCPKRDCENSLFGLCDDSKDGDTKPAYIDTVDSNKWIAIVHNENLMKVSFYVIDGCVSWERRYGGDSGKCDGMLCYDNNRNVLFVELKNRNVKYRDWRVDARNQLAETVAYFLEHNNRANFNSIKAYICNKKHLVNQRYAQFCDNFKQNTSITLYVSREIVIP
mgnify:CR=1 FL=1